MSDATTLNAVTRSQNYFTQTGRRELTPAQRRRALKKARRYALVNGVNEDAAASE